MRLRLPRVPTMLLLSALNSGSGAQTVAPARLLEPVWGASAQCIAMIEQTNRRAGQPQAEDYLAAGQMLEAGDCVARNETRASQYYGQAARRGNPVAARRLARLFGTGRGVPQSYANAGAWVAGKGVSDEGVEPWDYSIGVVFTLIAVTLDNLRYPQEAWPAGFVLSFVLDADTQRPGQVGLRLTGDSTPQAEALAAALRTALDAAVARALARMAPAERRYRVAARVTLPITVQRDAGDRFVVTEQDAVLR